MPRRKRSARPVEIVLTEEDLAAIIRETVRTAPGAPSPASPGPAPPTDASFPVRAEPPYGPLGDRSWSLGVRTPGAVGDAIRMILEATTLDRARRPGEG